MISMTGYGYSEFQNEKFDAVIELKSYNSKYFELYLYVPSFLSALEPYLREFITERIERGKVEIALRVKEIEEDSVISIDKNIAQAGITVLKQLAQIAGSDEEVTLSHLLKVEGIIKKIRNSDSDSVWNTIKPVLLQAYTQYNESRIKEGKKAEEDIFSQIEILKKSTAVFEKYASEIEEDIKKNIKERFQQMLGDYTDETRIYSEIAVLLMKFSINEEIVRLNAHLESFIAETKNSKLQIGKKLDFICQEMNREVNTIGSKSFKIEVSQAVIDAKDALDKIREQVRNIA